MTADTSPDGPYQRGCPGAGRSSGKQTDGPGSTRADSGAPARPGPSGCLREHAGAFWKELIPRESDVPKFSLIKS